MAVKRIEHVGLMVKDLETSIDFYGRVAGLKVKDRLLHTDGRMKLAFLGYGHSDETELELIQGYNDQLPQEGKVHHIAFAVDDIEVEWSRLQGLGIRFIDTSITTLPNGSRYFFFSGPDGEWVEFFQSTR